MQKMMNKPLMIAPQFLETISNAEWFERKNEIACAIYDGVASIPIDGLLIKSANFFSSFLGVASYESIGEAIARALEDPEVKSILLDIDSPGGEVSGLFDLVDFIYESREVKPIYAIVNDNAFSAAYAIASAASKIFMTRTSGVGSIGVIATHVDQSAYDKKEGIKYTTIFAGNKKNDMSPHEPLSSNAIADLQREVNRLYGMFVDAVARNRGISSESIRGTEAGLFYGDDAVANGLVDGVCNYNACLNLLKGRELEMSIARYKVLPQGNFVHKTETKAEVEAAEKKASEEITESEKKDTGVVEAADAETDADKTEESEHEYDSKIEEAIEQKTASFLEITRLCQLAGATDKINDFVMKNMSVDDVKKQLLSAIQDRQVSINSAIPIIDKKGENPLIAEAKARAEQLK
jgi:signal peptide peptidase SppA